MKTFYAGLCRLEAIVAGTFLVLMVILIFLGGVARMMGHPMNWTIDISTCLFSWACFLCADIAWRNNGLMSIELLVERLPPRWQRFCSYLNYLIIAGFLDYIVIAGTWLSWISRARSFQGIADVSYSWVTMSMPVGALMLLATTLLKVRDELHGKVAVNVAVDVV